MDLSICIALAVGTALEVLPTQRVTLGWTHTVEQTRWEEDYSASAHGLSITEARIESVGAGMEPPSSAVRTGKWWSYRPSLSTADRVTLANSSFATGYSICWNGACRPLAAIVPRDQSVAITTARCSGASGGPLPAPIEDNHATR